MYNKMRMVVNVLYYIKGIVGEINASNVIIETNGLGYLVNVSNPYSFEEGSNVKVYLYNHIREDENSLYGFKSKEELELFLKLINVKGLGPKMALPMFASSSVEGIMDAIERENILYLKKFPKVGDKVARQIILDLKGKLAPVATNNNESSELVEVLMSLGYKQVDIKKVLPHVDNNKKIEDQIKEALKLMVS